MPRTQTLERGLAILRAFQSEGRPLANSTIARRCGLPRPTVSRLTRTLVELGYLERVPDSGEYRLGRKVYDIGNAYLRGMKICSIARPYIHAFVKQYDISIGIAAQDDLEMIYILWVKEPKALTLRLRVGTALPITRTAVGKACLWALPLQERSRLIARVRSAEQKDLVGVSRSIESLLTISINGATAFPCPSSRRMRMGSRFPLSWMAGVQFCHSEGAGRD